MAVELALEAPDEAAAWALVERLGAHDPWCLELDGRTVRALFPAVPIELAGLAAELEPRAARFGAGWEPRARATRVGPLWVLPPERKAPSCARFVVRVNALVAFGAGTHPTTQLCLEKIVERAPSPMLDVGTGSGVLAIAALLLGAPRARGVDLEPRLLAEARENARLSGVPGLELGLELGDERWPLVVANVRTPALVTLAPALIAATTRELVLSGIREEERDEALAPYLASGARVARVDAREGWLRCDLSLTA